MVDTPDMPLVWLDVRGMARGARWGVLRCWGRCAMTCCASGSSPWCCCVICCAMSHTCVKQALSSSVKLEVTGWDLLRPQGRCTSAAACPLLYSSQSHACQGHSWVASGPSHRHTAVEDGECIACLLAGELHTELEAQCRKRHA